MVTYGMWYSFCGYQTRLPQKLNSRSLQYSIGRLVGAAV